VSGDSGSYVEGDETAIDTPGRRHTPPTTEPAPPKRCRLTPKSWKTPTGSSRSWRPSACSASVSSGSWPSCPLGSPPT